MSKKPCIHKIVVNVLKTSSYDILQINMCSIFKNNKIFKSQELIRSVNWFFISNSTHNRDTRLKVLNTDVRFENMTQYLLTSCK